MKPKIFFVTGTDTGIGKTTAMLALLVAMQAKQFSVVGLKPIATGGSSFDTTLRNDDALQLQAANSLYLPYATINPFCYELPVSPNFVAGEELSVSSLMTYIQQVTTLDVNYIFIEGVGGWFVPLNKHETIADFVMALNAPVIMVTGIKLGCLNHSLLTLRAIQSCNLTLRGWIANCVEEEILYRSNNIDYLQQAIAAPLLGIIPYAQETENRNFIGSSFNFF